MEQRRETRIPLNVRFFVHIHECEEDPDSVGTSISCEAVDISLHGMQFQTGEVIYKGSLLNLTIGIGDPFSMYLLRGQVRWVKVDEDEDHFIGVQLVDAEETDFLKWTENFAGTFEEEA